MTGRRLGAVVMAAAVVALAGCGDDAGGAADATTATFDSDVDRFCDLVEELGRARNAAFGELEGRNPGSADIREAERRFVEQNEAKLDEVVAVAPGDVKGAAETFVEGLRARAGLVESRVDPQTVDAANQGLNEFHQRHCDR